MKTKTGTISSAKMDKTVIISVHSYKNHPKYKKRYRVTKKFYAHDENNICREGDTVTFGEGRPLSKTKRWELITVNGQPLESVSHESIVKPTPEAKEAVAADNATKAPETN